MTPSPGNRVGVPTTTGEGPDKSSCQRVGLIVPLLQLHPTTTPASLTSRPNPSEHPDPPSVGSTVPGTRHLFVAGSRHQYTAARFVFSPTISVPAGLIR